ncbi:MAG: MinD/ParA family protein [Firmicutes bacterium]|nr:MinD/ParA family protein [Bacillota bacterium]
MSGQAEKLRMLMGDSRDGDPRDDPQAGAGGPRIVAVTSGKGGVGKSNFTLNAAISLGLSGVRVAILDADLGLGNIDTLLGATPRYNLLDLIRGDVGLDEVVITGPGGIRVIPGGSGIPELARLSEDELTKIMASLTQLESQTDIFMLDTGAGLGPGVMGFLKAVRDIIVIVTPEPTSITDAYAMIKAIYSENPGAEIGLVVNMVRDAGEGRHVAEKLGLVTQRFIGRRPTFAGYVPNDILVRRAVMRQEPFITAYPQSAAARCIRAIARSLEPLPRGVTRAAIGPGAAQVAPAAAAAMASPAARAGNTAGATRVTATGTGAATRAGAARPYSGLAGLLWRMLEARFQVFQAFQVSQGGGGSDPRAFSEDKPADTDQS